MTKTNFLAYISDPFAVVQPLSVVCDELGVCKEVTLQEVARSEEKTITYEAARLVEMLRVAGNQVPQLLIDATDALRISSGISRSDGGESQWNIVQAIDEYFTNAAEAAIFHQLISARIQRPKHNETIQILSAAALALRDLWADLTNKLREHGEEKRFFEVEVPVQQIFFARQFDGIRLEVNIAKTLIELARREKYTAFKELAGMLGFSPAGLNYRNIDNFLPNTDASHLAEFGSQANLEDYFEIARHSSKFADAFVRYKKAERDESVLTRTDCIGDRIHPTFNCFGTITARILVTEPRLQELRKHFRGMITPENGKRLLYLDYAQFEPGILGSIAGDASFKAFYQNADLYESLSIAVFNNKDNRNICKRIFLAYCYGMRLKNIAKLLAGATFSLENLMHYHETVLTFFTRFPGLEVFRRHSQQGLVSEGFTASLMGNRRIRQSSGALTPKEQRWSVNQRVQGTASLIFKTALIDLAETFGRASIVLPMHDAVLMQYDPIKNRPDRFENRAREIMLTAFKKWCPDIVPKVVVSDFAQPLDSHTGHETASRKQLDLPFSY